ncbi:AAA family ATPase, partial [Rhizobiaceae sp. 2RAB30]
PEAQLDRFLMHVQVNYPPREAEAEIMRLVRSEENKGKSGSAEKVEKLDPKVVLDARQEIGAVTVAEPVEKYIVALVYATREPAKLDKDLGQWIQVGVSPRGSIGLDKVSRAAAWLKGRDYVGPDDVRSVVHDVFRHRLVLSYEAHAAGVNADKVIDRLVELVAVA